MAIIKFQNLTYIKLWFGKKGTYNSKVIKLVPNYVVTVNSFPKLHGEQTINHCDDLNSVLILNSTRYTKLYQAESSHKE